MPFIVPESWEEAQGEEEQGEEEQVIVSAPIKKSISKWTKKYPELAEHCSALRIVLKGLNEEQTINTLENYLEAVTLWKPKVSFVGKREVDNRQKDKMNYQILYDRWVELINCVGLKENSTILERQNIQLILEKYTNKKIEKTKYVLDPRNNGYNNIR